MIKKKREKKTKAKKIVGGYDLNIGPYVPVNYASLTVEEMENLKKMYERDAQIAREISDKKMKEYDNQEKLLSAKRAQDISEAAKNESSLHRAWSRFRKYVEMIVNAIKPIFPWMISTFLRIIEFFRKLAINIWKIGSSIFEKIRITFILIGSYIGNTIIGRLFVRLIEGFIYFVRYVWESIVGFFKWLASTKIFVNFLFFKGPFPQIIALVILIAIFLGLFLGYAIPKTTDINNANIPPIPSGTATGATTGNAGAAAAGGESKGSEVKERTELDSEPNDEYFSFENIFTHLFTDGQFIVKLSTYIHKKIVETVFPPAFQCQCLASLNRITSSIRKISGQNTDADNYSVEREKITVGRPDNLYNINVELLRSGSINSIQDITGTNVYSIARPKDIEWRLPVRNYKDSDYSLLPDSIKNKKDTASKLSLEEKKSITIPWKMKAGGLYDLSCTDMYYTNNPTLKPSMLRDSDNDTCEHIPNLATVFNTPVNRHFDSNDLSTYVTA